MTLRVVFDTNIVVSAALDARPIKSQHGRPSLCLRLALSGIATIILSRPLLAEYEAVLLRPKFALPRVRVRALISLLRRNAEIVEPAIIPAQLVHDPNDLHVLATAVAGRADFLVTGNLRDFPEQHKGVRMVSPAQFLAAVVDIGAEE